jgi:hypothetical protein
MSVSSSRRSDRARGARPPERSGVRGPRERRREGVRRDEVPRLMKKSGYGREKGLESLASYTQVKNVCIKYT